jgi:hypothetical protein
MPATTFAPGSRERGVGSAGAVRPDLHPAASTESTAVETTTPLDVGMLTMWTLLRAYLHSVDSLSRSTVTMSSGLAV